MTQKTVLLFDDSAFSDITIPSFPPISLAVGDFVCFGEWIADPDLRQRYQNLVAANYVFEIEERELTWGPEDSTLTLFIRMKPE